VLRTNCTFLFPLGRWLLRAMRYGTFNSVLHFTQRVLKSAAVSYADYQKKTLFLWLRDSQQNYFLKTYVRHGSLPDNIVHIILGYTQNTFLFSNLRIYSVELKDNKWWWVWKDLEGSGRSLILRYHPGIRLGVWGKSRKTLVRIAGLGAEILTRYL
jgi:hypothetical protein